MCMLTYFPEGQQPDAERLLNGAVYNDDGHGFAIVDLDDKTLIIRKSMDAEFLIAEFVRMRAAYPLGPAMFHSRWGTGGSVDEYNCHPFYVIDRWSDPRQKLGKDSEWLYPGAVDRTVVGHNGILNVKQVSGDRRSDTRMAAEEVLGEWYDLADEEDRELVAEWIGPGNKFVILTVDPRFDRHAYIVNEKRGVWDEGVWYSNYDYIGYEKFSGAGRFPWAGEADDKNPWAGDHCVYCGTMGAGIDADGFCLTCGTCVDCLDERESCQCAMSGTRRESSEDYVDWWVAQDPDPQVDRRDDVIAAEAAAAADAEAEERLISVERALAGLGLGEDEVQAWLHRALKGPENIADLVAELPDDRPVAFVPPF